MATNIIKNPLFRVVTRNFAAEAATAQSGCESQSSILPNKLIVASQETCSPIARVSIGFKAGTRHECYDNLGTVHVLRSVAGLSTKNFSGFGIVRNIQQLGGSLYVTSDRETISYNLVILRDHLEKALPFLSDMATQQVFKPWELADNVPRLRYDLSLTTPEVRALDLLHQAAFRTGLGNSLFVKKDVINKHNTESLCHYVNKNFTSNRASVVGLSVDHKYLTSFAECLPLCSGDCQIAPSTYHGGEIRKDKSSDFASVAVAVEGASNKDPKQALTYLILQHALGVGPSIIYGSGASPLGKQVSELTSGACAINVSYSDSGLFGVFVSGSAGEIGIALEKAVKLLRTGDVSENEIKRAKNQVKTALLNRAENSFNVIEDMSSQVLQQGVVVPAKVIAEAINSISSRDVQDAAKKIASGKLSMGAVGNLKNVPYIDQLK